MSWQDQLDELTFAVDKVLREDLAGLQRMPERRRIELYNEIEDDRQEFEWTFMREHSEQITGAEEDRIIGRFKLAQLMLAASFHEDGEVPRPLDEQFIDAELQAVVDFDRYKVFDALDEDQIAEKIRRMEGEVYELATEYTSTQIANMDEMLDNPNVQQDVMERLVERYDDRREKVRHGFFVYVETHGIEEMVEAIEDAVTAVNDSRDEREAIKEELREEMRSLETSLDERVREQREAIEREVRAVEADLASQTISEADLDRRMAELREETGGLSEAQEEALEELNSRIDRTAELEDRLEDRIAEMERVREQAAEAEREAAREEAAALVDDELEELREQRDELRSEVDRLQREREEIEAARDALDDRQDELEDRVESMETSFDTDAEGEGIEGENLVTATIARLMEMDYLGRFDVTMHETESLYTPDGTFEVPDGYWDGRGERRSEEPRLADLLADREDDTAAGGAREDDTAAGGAREDGARPDSFPANRRARYWLTDSRHLGLTRETKLVVEAIVHSHLEAFAENDFDARPLDLDDLLGLVNDTVSEAERAEQPYLVAVASPTGFTDRVRNEVAGESSRTRFSRYLSLVLVDLQSGELLYDESDDLAAENERLFAVPVDDERIEACLERLREHASDPGTHSVVVSELEGEGFDSHVAKRAFDRAVAAGLGEQLYVEPHGLSLVFE